MCMNAHTCVHMHTHMRLLVREAHLTMKTGLDTERWAIMVYFSDWHQSLIILSITQSGYSSVLPLGPT